MNFYKDIFDSDKAFNVGYSQHIKMKLCSLLYGHLYAVVVK